MRTFKGTVGRTTYRYRVMFRMGDQPGIVWGEALADVKDGFWIGEDFKLTKGSDAWYFILPHMITQILKVPMDEQKED